MCSVDFLSHIFYLKYFEFFLILKMFKKNPQPKASANIKSSERRKLLKSVCDRFDIPQEKLAKECELDLLPSVVKQATFKSIQGFSGIIYYNEKETPLWFKSRDSTIYPSLFTLWKCPFVLPIVKTHPHVITILKGGADLMLPGTIPPFDSRCVKNSVVGIAASDAPDVIMAIGVCKLNMTQFDNVIGRVGVAVEVIHHIDDELFKLNKFEEIPVPTSVNTEMKLKEPENEIASTEEPVQEEEDNEETTTEEINEGDNNPNDKSEKDNNIDDVAEVLSELSVEDIDNFFIRSLLQTIKVESIELPISSSTFMSTYIYKNLPQLDPVYCNIKRTSWKKTAKFLKAMDKLKYISVKGKGDDLTIVKLMSKEDTTIVNFVTHRINSIKGSQDKPQTPAKKANEMSVIQYYKPTSKSRMFFNKLEMDYSRVYTANELRSLLESYVKKFQLVDKKNPKLVIIDSTLKPLINSGTVSTPRDKLFKAFLTSFSPNYKIVKPSESADNAILHKGTPQSIKIITEMKIGRKIVTRLVNFEEFYIKAHLLADELKVKCSGSTTIGPCVQNPKLTEVTVQGPHGKVITNLLRDKGIPISYIEFDDRTKKKR